MKYALLFILILNPINIFAAETAIVSGYIRDATNNPLENALIIIGDKSDFSDTDGRYRIKSVSLGKQRIQVKKNKKVIWEEEAEITETTVTKDITVP